MTNSPNPMRQRPKVSSRELPSKDFDVSLGALHGRQGPYFEEPPHPLAQGLAQLPERTQAPHSCQHTQCAAGLPSDKLPYLPSRGRERHRHLAQSSDGWSSTTTRHASTPSAAHAIVDIAYNVDLLQNDYLEASKNQSSQTAFQRRYAVALGAQCDRRHPSSLPN